MRKILHILKDPNNAHALACIKRHSDEHQVSLLLIQDAVGMRPSGMRSRVFVLADDLGDGEKSPYPQVGYPEMLRMIFKHDTVIAW